MNREVENEPFVSIMVTFLGWFLVWLPVTRGTGMVTGCERDRYSYRLLDRYSYQLQERQVRLPVARETGKVTGC